MAGDGEFADGQCAAIIQSGERCTEPAKGDHHCGRHTKKIAAHVVARAGAAVGTVTTAGPHAQVVADAASAGSAASATGVAAAVTTSTAPATMGPQPKRARRERTTASRSKRKTFPAVDANIDVYQPSTHSWNGGTVLHVSESSFTTRNAAGVTHTYTLSHTDWRPTEVVIDSEHHSVKRGRRAPSHMSESDSGEE